MRPSSSLARAVIEKGAEGDVQGTRVVADRLDAKVAQAIAGDDELQLVAMIVTGVVRADDPGIFPDQLIDDGPWTSISRQAAGARDRKKEAHIIPCQVRAVLFIYGQYMRTNRSLKMGPDGPMSCRAGWNERAALMIAIDPATVFRAAIAAQGTALRVQTLLAGLAISGSDAALDAHKPVGALSRQFRRCEPSRQFC